MKDQVLSKEQMQHLQSLGVDISKASMCWWIPTGDDIDSPDLHLRSANEEFINHIPTFTLQDILDILPKRIEDSLMDYDIEFFYECGESMVRYLNCLKRFTPAGFAKKNFLESAYQMLLWCIEKGHIKTN